MPLPAAAPGSIDALATDFARIMLEHDPLLASELGLHERDAELPIWTIERLDAYARDLRALRDQVASTTVEDLEDDVDRRGLLGLLAARLADLEVERTAERNPFLWASGGVHGVLRSLVSDHLPAEQREAAVIGRCEAMAAYLDASHALLDPVEVPLLWVTLAVQSARGGAAFLRDSVVEEFPGAGEAAAGAATTLDAYAQWLEDDLEPRAGGHYALGETALAGLLSEVHLLDESPEQVAATGEALMAHYAEELARAARGRDWRAALEEARAAHPTLDELVPRYQEELRRLQAFCVEHDLVTDPEAPAVLEATPEFLRPTMGYAAYLPPGPFDEVQAGKLWVTPPAGPEAFGDHSYAAMQPITAHEGYPGHHLQLTSVGRLDSVTRRLPIGTALMVEGWGLYTEELMHEAGYYTPDGRLVQLAMAALRATRIVADMGLHTGALTTEEAVDLLVDRAGISHGVAQAEVNRYTMMPTQPFSYLYGAEEIRRIRAAWRRQTGGSLRAFHDALLSYGHLPPALAAEALLPPAPP